MDANRMQGAFLGLVWGDALGCPVEGWRSHEIEAVYGEYTGLPREYPFDHIPDKRKKKLRPLGLHSDDTQQAMALLLLLLTGEWDRKRWKRMLVRGLEGQAWRGIGRNFVAAVHRLRKGVDLKQSGSPSAGIGAAMRTGPVGALFPKRDQRDIRLTVVLESSLMTHSDQRAAVFAAVVSEAVSLYTQYDSPNDVLEELADFALLAEERAQKLTAEGWRVDFAESRLVSGVLRKAMEWADQPVSEVRRQISKWALPHLAKGFTRAHPNQGFVLLGGLHALMMASRSDLEPEEALLSIIREGYDTDTVAAIAGSLLGARHGFSWIPTNRLLNEKRMQDYALALIHRTAPETEEAFVNQEAEWTAQEQELQRRLLKQHEQHGA